MRRSAWDCRIFWYIKTYQRLFTTQSQQLTLAVLNNFAGLVNILACAFRSQKLPECFYVPIGRISFVCQLFAHSDACLWFCTVLNYGSLWECSDPLRVLCCLCWCCLCVCVIWIPMFLEIAIHTRKVRIGLSETEKRNSTLNKSRVNQKEKKGPNCGQLTSSCLTQNNHHHHSEWDFYDINRAEKEEPPRYQ